MLSENQVGFYREHGYLVLHGLFDREYLIQLITVTDEFVAGAKDLTQENQIYDLRDGCLGLLPQLHGLNSFTI